MPCKQSNMMLFPRSGRERLWGRNGIWGYWKMKVFNTRGEKEGIHLGREKNQAGPARHVYDCMKTHGWSRLSRKWLHLRAWMLLGAKGKAGAPSPQLPRWAKDGGRKMWGFTTDPPSSHRSRRRRAWRSEKKSWDPRRAQRRGALHRAPGSAGPQILVESMKTTSISSAAYVGPLSYSTSHHHAAVCCGR